MIRLHGRSACSRGVSLIEALVSLLLFSVVIVVPMYLLFTMRTYAEKQQYTIVPRQTARRAMEYLSYYVEGASDLNAPAAAGATLSPNAIITYFNRDASEVAPGTPVQASYDNLTSAQAGLGYGDEGTDIISLAIPSGPQVSLVPILQFPLDGADQPVQLTYRAGCGPLNDDAANLAQFQTVTGASGVPPRSGLLTAIDSNGNWIYFRIKSYVPTVGACADPFGANINVTASPGRPTTSPDFGPIDVPNGHTPLSTAINNPTFLTVGLKFVSFRVRNGNLEQKNGIFSPIDLPALPEIGNADTTAGGNTNFFTVMENVEDFQVAYLYGNAPMFAGGGVWNSASQTLATGVPPQRGTNPLVLVTGDDIINVIGLRISVLGRSTPMSLGSFELGRLPTTGTVAVTKNFHFRPAIENHTQTDPPPYDRFPPAGTGVFERYRATTTILLRNRILGS